MKTIIGITDSKVDPKHHIKQMFVTTKKLEKQRKNLEVSLNNRIAKFSVKHGVIIVPTIAENMIEIYAIKT